LAFPIVAQKAAPL